MKYLVDANVLSEPTRPSPNAKVVAWMEANERHLVVDSIILGELYMGILALPEGRRRSRLEQWFDSVVRTLDCLAWDTAVSRQWARLAVTLRKSGKPVPILDGMIAATALEHRLTVVTRNRDDFERTGVEVFDPFVS